MYDITKYSPRIHLIGGKGTYIEYENWDAFIGDVDEEFVKHHIVMTFKNYPLNDFYCYSFLLKRGYINLYVVRDEWGSVFSPAEILYAVRGKELVKKWYNKRHFLLKSSNFEYRIDTVPFTGKRMTNYFGCWYKQQKTSQEIRWSIVHKEFVRAKRRKCNLPNSWDDKPRGDVGERKNWKNHRKSQWKYQRQNIKKYFREKLNEEVI
jgi:hypothetical protein